MQTNNGLRFKEFFSRITNTQGFGVHIDTSIPGYAENRARMAVAAASLGGPVLDVGASEGQWGRTIQRVNPDVRVIDLDPNPDMLRNNINPNSEKVMGAWVEGFEDNGVNIPAFDSQEKFKAIGMHMVRQFVTRDADTWYSEVQKFLAYKGVFMLCVKVVAEHDDKGEWAEQEKVKDAYKRLTYTQEEMDSKSDEVLVGMHSLMLPHSEELATLSRHFNWCECVWRSANFRGYFASDDYDTLQAAVKAYNLN